MSTETNCICDYLGRGPHEQGCPAILSSKELLNSAWERWLRERDQQHDVNTWAAFSAGFASGSAHETGAVLTVEAVRAARLEWAMVCGCACKACDALYIELQRLCGDLPEKTPARPSPLSICGHDDSAWCTEECAEKVRAVRESNDLNGPGGQS